MNLRDLKYLVAVAEHGHFGRAAQSCFVSQPTLSTQIKKLEDSLGVTLFERTNRKVMLTPIGEQLVRQAKIVLRDADELVNVAALARDPFGGNFRLGVIPTVAPYLLPLILPCLRAAFPELKLSLIEAQTASLMQMLPSGELDGVIAALPFDLEQVKTAPLYREDFLLTLPIEHSKAQRKHAVLGDLQGEEVLLLEDGHCLRDQALEVCNTASAVENTNFRATSLETLRQMVAAGIGVTLMPALAAQTSDNVSYLPFGGKGKPSQRPHRNVGLIWRDSSPRQLLLEAMSEQLAEKMRVLPDV